MPRQVKIKSIRNQLPTRYCHPQVLRFIMIAFAAAVFGYALYFMLRFVTGDTPVFFKIMPLVIMFVSLDSVLRHTTALNCVKFTTDTLSFSYLLKKRVVIPYENVLRIDLYKRITYYVHLRYRDSEGREQLFKTAASFPKILEIIVNIADLSPHVQMDEMLTKAVTHLREQAEAEDAQQV